MHVSNNRSIYPALNIEKGDARKQAWNCLRFIRFTVKGVLTELEKIAEQQDKSSSPDPNNYLWLTDATESLRTRNLGVVIEKFNSINSPHDVEILEALITIHHHSHQISTDFCHSLDKHLEALISSLKVLAVALEFRDKPSLLFPTPPSAA